MVRLFVYISIVLLMFLYFFISDENMDKEVMLIILVSVGISTLLFFSKNEKNTLLQRQFFKHSTFAILGILIVCFQYYIDYILGNVDYTDNFIFVNKDIVVKSLTVSVIGYNMFLIGYMSFETNPHTTNNVEKVYHTKVLEVLLFAALLLFLATVNMSYVLGGYGKEELGSGGSYFDLLLKIFIISIVVQKSRNLIIEDNRDISLKDYIINLDFLTLFSVAIYLFIVLLSGDRGPLITVSLFILSGYLFVTKHKFKFYTLAVAVVCVSAVITTLGVARSFDSGLNFKEKIELALKDDKKKIKSFLPQTGELAVSVNSIHQTVNHIPVQHDYLYGRFQLQQLTSSVPFFYMFNNVLFEDNSRKYAGSASFVTWIFQGDRPTSGNGTSVIADFYFDFGLWGVIFGMFLYGYAMRYAEVSMYVFELPSLFGHVFFTVYLGSALYIARSSFLFEFRTVVWVALILLLNRYYFNKAN